jgi:hypothetical protein
MHHPLHVWESALDDHAPRFISGTPIYDTKGVQVGVVSPYHMQGGELLMRKGRFLFATDVVLPLEAVAGVEARGIRLRYTKAEIERQAWVKAVTLAPSATDGVVVAPLLPTEMTSLPSDLNEAVEPPPAA